MLPLASVPFVHAFTQVELDRMAWEYYWSCGFDIPAPNDLPLALSNCLDGLDGYGPGEIAYDNDGG